MCGCHKSAVGQFQYGGRESFIAAGDLGVSVWQAGFY